MNDQRREQLRQAENLLTQAWDLIEVVKDEEDEAYNSMPENLQQGQQGEKLQYNIGELEEALASLDDADSHIEEALK